MESRLEQARRRVTEPVMVDGCKGCGMVYSFVFNLQFHRNDCPTLQSEQTRKG